MWLKTVSLVEWSLYFKTTQWTMKLLSYISAGHQIKVQQHTKTPVGTKLKSYSQGGFKSKGCKIEGTLFIKYIFSTVLACLIKLETTSCNSTPSTDIPPPHPLPPPPFTPHSHCCTHILSRPMDRFQFLGSSEMYSMYMYLISFDHAALINTLDDTVLILLLIMSFR